MLKHVLLFCLLVFAAMSLCACQNMSGVPLPAAPTTNPPESLSGDLVFLSFSEGHSYRKRVEGYAFNAENGTYTVLFHLADKEDPHSVPVDQAWVDTLTQIVRQHRLQFWNGFNERADGLLDGSSFSITLRFSDDAVITAGGYGRFPDGYGDASKAIEAHFLQLLPEELREW